MLQNGNDDVILILNQYYSTFEKDIAETGWFFVNRLHNRLSEQSVRSTSVGSGCGYSLYTKDVGT